MKLNIRLPLVLTFLSLIISEAFGLSISGLWENTIAQSFLKLASVQGNVVYQSDISLLSLHKQLTVIPSVSGNEENVGKFLKRYLESKGLTVELQKVADDPLRENAYAYLGSKRDNRVLLTSHIDTVPPFLPYYVEGNKIYGRGTCDAKGSVATQITAFLDLVNENKINEGEVALLFVVGEEVDGKGMLTVSEKLNTTWESVIFGEPTELKLGVGHKGNYLFKVEAQGKASHSGYPELGISANEALVPVLNDLLNLKLPRSDLLGPSTLNIGKMTGGVASNVIPAHAEAFVFIRVAAGLAEIDGLVHGVIDDVEHVTIEVIQRIEPQYLDYEVPGFENIVLAYATDVPNLKGTFKRYLYGPGSIHVAHGDDEFVTVEDLLEAVDGFKKLVNFTLQN